MKGLLLSAMLILSSITSSNAAIKNNNELKIGSAQESDSLNPIVSTMLISNYIYSSVGRTLNVLDSKGNWVTQLAKVTPSFKNGLAKVIGTGKNKKIEAIWQIKDNANWGDGTPVTGHDVAFTLKVATNPKVTVASIDSYNKIESISVDKKNPKIFKVIYKKVVWDFYQMATFFIIPKHLEEKPYNKFGNKPNGYINNTNYVKNPTLPGLYNGPYKVTQYKQGSHITVKTNNKFYGNKPKIEKVIFKVIPNTSTLESNLRSGTIDMISPIGISFDQALAFNKRVLSNNLNYNVIFKPGLVFEHIELNLNKNPILKDKNIRQALNYGINKKELTKALFDNKQTAALHRFSEVDKRHTKDKKFVNHYKYSRRKAKKLIKSSGWTMGKDGYFVKNGKRLSLTIKSTAGNKTREVVEVFIQNQLKNIGFELKIKNEPARVLFGETLKNARYDMIMFAWSLLPEDNLIPFYHSSSIPTKKNGLTGNNSMSWKNKKVDELLEKIQTELDSKKRTSLSHQFLKLYTEEVPEIPLYYRSNVAVLPKSLKGVDISPHRFTATNEIENWHYKK
jgi:peptide/nickel transport system substrate-binding protein